MRISRACEADLEEVPAVERAAFGEEEEAELVRALLDDATARPSLSLIAREARRLVGHVLFTAARIDRAPDVLPSVAPCEAEDAARQDAAGAASRPRSSGSPRAAILAPLAVVPDAQGRGVGSGLVRRGMGLLAEEGVGLVFVLGHAEYYRRFGFEPAGRRGFEAPYPIDERHADAWMVRGLHPGPLGAVKGVVRCADALDRPEYWRE